MQWKVVNYAYWQWKDRAGVELWLSKPQWFVQ